MHAHIVVDLGFGDAGKGSLVDFLVRRHGAHTVIRFNGGAQAAHNVVLPDGRHHTFSQFGSGTFVERVRTHLSRYMLVDPVALMQEERHLRGLGIADAWGRLSIDRRAVVVSPFQKAGNRLRELSRGDGRHGSCGMGVGETMADLLEHEAHVVRVGDLRDRAVVRGKLRYLQRLKRRQAEGMRIPRSEFAERELGLLHDGAAVEEFASLFEELAGRFAIVPSAEGVLAAPGEVVFEGAQGVLLDEWYGFHPYTTWSTTHFGNALTLLKEHGYAGEVTRIGAMRAYMTRHGPGPLVTEDDELGRRIPERHNRMNAWQREFRIGWLDLVMLRYALEISGGVDQLAVTCLDHVGQLGAGKICRRYEGRQAEFFAGDWIRRKEAAALTDLAYQERLTQALMECRPAYEELESAELVSEIEASLGNPVGITSSGPTWRDKVMIESGAKKADMTLARSAA